MEKGFMKYGYYYERKLRQYDEIPNIDTNHIVVNETVARSYLSIVLKMPSDASRRKYKVWGELYNRIFHGKQSVEPYVLATKIYLQASGVLKNDKYSNSSDDIQRILANNGSFHIARIISYLWRGHDRWGNELTEEMKKNIDILEKSPQFLDKYLDPALEILGTIIKNEYSTSDVVNSLKLASLDIDIDRNIHTRKKVIRNSKK